MKSVKSHILHFLTRFVEADILEKLSFSATHITHSQKLSSRSSMCATRSRNLSLMGNFHTSCIFSRDLWGLPFWKNSLFLLCASCAELLKESFHTILTLFKKQITSPTLFNHQVSCNLIQKSCDLHDNQSNAFKFPNLVRILEISPKNISI